VVDSRYPQAPAILETWWPCPWPDRRGLHVT
jgi:hypothetical protein